MSTEERDFTATAPPYTMTVARLNSIQDHWVHGWEARNSGLSPTTDLLGATEYVGIFTCLNAASTLIDGQRDWRRRILEVDGVQVAAANQLPKGVNYDPLAFVANFWNIQYTGTGATLAIPPVGEFWTFRPTLYLFASNAAGGGIVAGDLVITNNTGGTVYIYLMVNATQDVG